MSEAQNDYEKLSKKFKKLEKKQKSQDFLIWYCIFVAFLAMWTVSRKVKGE